MKQIPFRPLLDVMAIAACFILACGRIGNFIDGQIHGSLTEFFIAVRFPEIEGFRHPVVLYDGLKNFLLIPLLLWIKSKGVPPGRIAALFVLLYAGLRLPIDMLRDYPVYVWGFPTGQSLNVIMILIGVAMLAVNIYRNTEYQHSESLPVNDKPAPIWKKIAFVSLLLLPLVIPSDATRDVPDRYGKRHPGLVHSQLYPPIAEKVNQ